MVMIDEHSTMCGASAPPLRTRLPIAPTAFALKTQNTYRSSKTTDNSEGREGCSNVMDGYL